jgi:ferrous iron transport protein A
MVPLIFIESGKKVKIQKVGGKAEAKKHLQDLGFVDGSVSEIISSHSGDVILKIKDSRLAITREMAQHIMVDIIN